MARFSSRTSRAFTLIELLIVIAIIGILMALLFPAVNGAIDAARKAQAKNDVTQIATAVTAYETEYGKLPNASGNIDSTLVNILTGVSTNNNPRKIVFMEIGTFKKNSKSGTNSGGSFLDPWGNNYQIAVDDNYDNTIASAGSVEDHKVSNLRKKVAVWNDVTIYKNPSEKKRRAVTSWE